jgi:hypothetical protein
MESTWARRNAMLLFRNMRRRVSGAPLDFAPNGRGGRSSSPAAGWVEPCRLDAERLAAAAFALQIVRSSLRHANRPVGFD